MHSVTANRRRGNAYVMFTIHGDVVLLGDENVEGIGEIGGLARVGATAAATLL